MVQTEKCRRCLLPILGEGFIMHLDSRQPRPEGLEVVLCDSCVESMSRWLTRRGRPREAFQTGVAMAIEGPEPLVGRAQVRERFATTIDRFTQSDRQKMVVGMLLGSLAMGSAVALIVLTLVGDGFSSP